MNSLIATWMPRCQPRVIDARRRLLPELRQSDFYLPVLDAWVKDNRFILDLLKALNERDPAGRFTRRLDLTSVGALGHSTRRYVRAFFDTHLKGARDRLLDRPSPDFPEVRFR